MRHSINKGMRPNSLVAKECTRQRGAVAIVVGLSLVVLIGMGGLALDLSRLYINKTELQTSADACALAAAGELICPTGTACQTLAESKGILAAGRNRRDFQRLPASIAAADVRFSTNFVPNSAYLPAGAAPAGSRFAMCTARSNGIVPWLMGVVGIGNQNVSAQAVATLGPGATVCPSAPIGACPRSGGGSYNVGDWIAASHNDGGPNDDEATLGNPRGNYGTNVRGTFRWVDWDYPGGGANEVRGRLAGSTTCGISPASSSIAEPGDKQGVKNAYNTRFGIYTRNGANAYNVTTAPPDRTGWSYPTRAGGGAGAINVGQSAFTNYMQHYATADPYQGSSGQGSYNANAVGTGNAGPKGTESTRSEHSQYGSHRRLITVPMVDSCSGVGGAITFSTMGCFLMLNPMSNGNNGDVFLEYRGGANTPGSPCASGGGPGGPGSNTGLVPTLVQ